MRIAIYSRGFEADQSHGIKSLLNELASYKIEPVIFQDFFNQFYCSVKFDNKYSTFNSPEDLEDIDCIISLGGDGTLLDTATFAQDRKIPVLGSIMEGLDFWQALVKMNCILRLKHW